MIEKLIPTIQRVCDYQLKSYREGRVEFTTKAGPTDFVSEVDIQSQQMIVEQIETLFPDAGILGEEGCAKRVFEAELLFVIDPLDGTSNYRSKLDNWAISVGLLKNGCVHEGLIAFPLLNHIICHSDLSPYTALHFHSPDDLFLFGTDRLFDHQQFHFKNLKKRLLGATVPTIYFCLREAFQNRPGFDFALLGTSKLWDVAGVAACLKQVGGSLLNLDGEELLERDLLRLYTAPDRSITRFFPIIASANPSIARLICQTLKDEKEQKRQSS